MNLEEDHRVKVSFLLCHIQDTQYQQNITFDVDPDHLAEVLFVRFSLERYSFIPPPQMFIFIWLPRSQLLHAGSSSPTRDGTWNHGVLATGPQRKSPKLPFVSLLLTVIFGSKSLSLDHTQGTESCSTNRMAVYLHKLSGILLPGRFVSSPSHATCSVFPGNVHRSLSESSTPPVLVRIFPGEASPESLKNRLILASEPAELWLKVRKANVPPRGPAWGRSCEQWVLPDREMELQTALVKDQLCHLLIGVTLGKSLQYSTSQFPHLIIPISQGCCKRKIVNTDKPLRTVYVTDTSFCVVN